MEIQIEGIVLQRMDGTGALQLTDAACSVCGRPTETRDATLREVIVMALGTGYQDERLDRDIAGKRFVLALKVQNAVNAVELSSKEITTILDLIVKRFPNPFYGRAAEILDPSSLPKEKE